MTDDDGQVVEPGTDLVPVAPRKCGGKKPVVPVSLGGVPLGEPLSATYHELHKRLAPGEVIGRRSDGGLYVALPSGYTGGETRQELAARAAAAQTAVDATTRAQLENAFNRESFNRAFAQGVSKHTTKMLELDVAVLERALKDDASAADKRLALQVTSRWMDRLGGKAVAPTEQVEGAGSIAERFMRGGR